MMQRKRGKPLEIGQSLTTLGTVNALIVSFYRSGDFTGLSNSTKATYRGIIERFRAVLDNRHAVKPGAALRLKPQPDKIRWFDAETGAALS